MNGLKAAYFVHRVKDSVRDPSAVVLFIGNFHRLPAHSTVLSLYFCVVQITQFLPFFLAYTVNKQTGKKQEKMKKGNNSEMLQDRESEGHVGKKGICNYVNIGKKVSC